MLTPVPVNALTFFYPVGNTPAVSLTQSLPPDSPAYILLLGCGDARNILFTRHIDDREMDITCCDNQKAVIARNILLFSLIIDGQDLQSGNSLWSIYYHMYIDKESLDLLRSQARKLYELSASMDTWQQSKYGSSLRLCDSATLADLKRMWSFYSMERKGDEASQFNRRFESVLSEVKAIRFSKGIGADGVGVAGFRSAIPAHHNAFANLNDLHHHYWEHGSTELNAHTRATEQYPNPTFLPLEYEVILHFGTDPMLGFHHATAAYAPLRSNDPALERVKNLPRPERLVMAARTEFSEWIASYRNHNSNMRIRFFIGDAISFAHTLQNKRVKRLSTGNWYRDQYCFQRLQLDGPDYSSSVAPLYFDVIDTSDLCDHVGSLVLLTACSPLLLNRASSILYTEVIAESGQKHSEVLNHMLCGHVPTLSTLLDLFPLEYWTNTSSVPASEAQALDGMTDAITSEAIRGKAQHVFLRSRWRRPISTLSCYGPPEIRFEPTQLAKALYKVYAYMFHDEDHTYKVSPENLLSTPASSLAWYHRASFDAFLRLVQTRVTVDWSVAMDRLLALVRNRPMGMNYQELHMHLHLLDSCSSNFQKFWRQPHNDSALSTGMKSMSLSHVTPPSKKWGDLRDWKDIPTVVCITLKIPRQQLAIFTETNREELSAPFAHCTLKGPGSQGPDAWQDIFTACQLGFGDISTRGKLYDNSFEVSVVEDEAGWNGTSPLIAAFYVPAVLLLRKPRKAAIAFGIHNTGSSTHHFASELDLGINIYETTLENSSSVYITRYAPNQAGFPVAIGFSPRSRAKATDIEAEVSLIAVVDRENGHIVTFTSQLYLTGDSYKNALRNECQVERSAMSPCEISIRLKDTTPLVISFPVCVVENSLRERIVPSSSYIGVSAKVATVSQWMDYPDYMYPVLLQHGEITNWNIPYINLRTCPIVDVDRPSHKPQWLRPHLTLMMSARERAMRSQMDMPRPAGEFLRLKFKDTLETMFLHFAGLGAEKRNVVFGLKNGTKGDIHILILVSSLRINLADRAAVLDCAVIPFYHDPALNPEKLITPLLSQGVLTSVVEDAEMQLWRRVLPAYVERCRTWTHRDSCEYVRAGTIPLSTENGKQCICTCGNGNFPQNFIRDIPNWEALAKHAVRAAISPAF
ncbi:hypothetical protein GGR51DRAFT_543152 [Nemania sp. FL0031]|nr:hypothetical protein GGR51DRAFT_543152 [Nemania sp. FL0031]